MANVTIRMTSNLFFSARHHDTLLPRMGETVDIPADGAESLVRSGHAEIFEAVKPEAKPEAKRAAGRPRKTEG